jgi:hypothetical protein
MCPLNVTDLDADPARLSPRRAGSSGDQAELRCDRWERWGDGYLRNVGWADLEVVALTGTAAAPPVRLNTPEQAAGRYSSWVNNDQGVIFYVAKLFLVDICAWPRNERMGR